MELKLGVYKLVKQPNQYTTKWQRFVWRVKHFFKTLIVLLSKMTALSMAIVLIFMAGQWSKPDHVLATSTDSFPDRINQLQNEVVDSISKLENESNIPAIPDDNKAKSLPLKDKVSYGCMQFKVGTIEHYYAVLKLGKISDIDSAVLALDCSRAKELAKQIIFETNGGLWNWSSATDEMASKVGVIKELMK